MVFCCRFLPTYLQIVLSLKAPQWIHANGIMFLSKTLTDAGVQLQGGRQAFLPTSTTCTEQITG